MGFVCALVGLAGPAVAAPFEPSGAAWDGLADFLELAAAEVGPTRVVVDAELDYRTLTRADAVLVVHPECALDVDNLGRFMRDGGRVILLDDYGTGDELLAHYGIERIPTPKRPLEMLRKNPSFAIAQPAGAHAVVEGVGRVVTNHPTGLRHPDLSPVLEIRGDGEPSVLVGIAGAVNQGRLLAIGDPSIFINAMLRYPGNRALAAGLVRYAIDDDAAGARGGRIHVVVGDFGQVGSYGQEDDLGLGGKLRTVRSALATLGREGVPPAGAYVTAVALGVAVIVWVASRAGRLHRPVSPSYTRAIPLAAQGGIAGHAAVIAAPGTSRVLAMLELKSALEEELANRLGLDRVPGSKELVERLAAEGMLGEASLRDLRALLLRMAQIETFVLARREAAEPVSDAEVVDVARRVRRILDEARR